MPCTNTDDEYDDSFSATEKEISLVKLQKCLTLLLYTFM